MPKIISTFDLVSPTLAPAWSNNLSRRIIMQNVAHDRNSRSLLRALAWLFAVTLLAPEWAAAQEKPPAPWNTTKARGVTRDIDFDTSEGTWMSLDVSSE